MSKHLPPETVRSSSEKVYGGSMDKPEYRDATDIEVVVIEWVRNVRVGDHKIREMIDKFPDDAARVVLRRPIGDTYYEALEILKTRGLGETE